MAEMRCYKCDQKVTSKDKIVFLATLPVHRDGCPKKRVNKLQTAAVLIRVLAKNHPNKELVGRANRWLQRQGLRGL